MVLCVDISEKLLIQGIILAQSVLLVTTHGTHHHTGEQPTGFHDTKVVRDAEHINEHLEGVANAKDMSAEELEFHYFKLHDFDNNTKLDGLEIYKALSHLLPFEEMKDKFKDEIDVKGKTRDEIKEIEKNKVTKYFSDIVDDVLTEDDLDNDGYLTYAEYVIARRREEARDAADKRQGNSNG